MATMEDEGREQAAAAAEMPASTPWVRGKGQVARCRAALYSFLAQALVPPGEELHLGLKEGLVRLGLAETVRGLSPVHRRHLEPLVERMPMPMGDEAPSWDALRTEYTRLFATDLLCPHYEADYVIPDPFRVVHVISELVSFYNTFGLRVAETAQERPDYIAIELDFMNFLATKEALAASRAESQHVKLCRRASEKFFSEHLGRWGRPFARTLGEAAEGSFYRAVHELLAAWMVAEAEFLGVALEEIEPREPAPPAT